MATGDQLSKVPVTSSDQLREWLLANHQQQEGVWLVTYKKAVPDKYVSVSEVLDELIAFGWTDGRRKKLDEERTMQLISPRRAQHWSKTYKVRAAKLEQEGRMHEAGRRAFAKSKELGLWDFLDDVDALIKPDDLEKALDQFPPARDAFDAFAPSTQRFILRWIKLAKTAKTRAARIEQTAKLAQIGEKIPGS